MIERNYNSRLRINVSIINMNEKLIGLNFQNIMIFSDLNEKCDQFDLEGLCEELIIDED
jgi:hypothetical protein